MLTPLAADHYRRTPWKNGGGVAIDIADAGRQGGWQDFGWRFSRTAIVAPGPFSDLTGCERMQAVIGGTGLVLVTPDGEIDLRQPFVPVRYDGGTPITTRLENGPVEVINLFTQRSAFTMDMTVLRGGEIVTLKPGIHVAYAPDAATALVVDGKAADIPGGDALKVEASSPRSLELRSGLVVLASLFAL